MSTDQKNDQTFTPPPVIGYRPLTPRDVDLMNQVKSLGIRLGNLVEEIAMEPGVDMRAVSIARTELQTGLMWLTRAIAKPMSF